MILLLLLSLFCGCVHSMLVWIRLTGDRPNGVLLAGFLNIFYRKIKRVCLGFSGSLLWCVLFYVLQSFIAWTVLMAALVPCAIMALIVLFGVRGAVTRYVAPYNTFHHGQSVYCLLVCADFSFKTKRSVRSGLRWKRRRGNDYRRRIHSNDYMDDHVVARSSDSLARTRYFRKKKKKIAKKTEKICWLQRRTIWNFEKIV